MSRLLIVAGCLMVLAGLCQPATADTIYSATANCSNESPASTATLGPAVNGTNGLTLPTGDYSNIGSTVTGTGGTSGGGAILYTTATLAGDNLSGAPESIAMRWRTRTLYESFPWEPNATPTQPPLDISGGVYGLASDVVDVSGFSPDEVYVLQMSYNPTLFNEAVEAANGCIHVDWLDGAGSTAMWVNAISGNSQILATAEQQNYQQSYGSTDGVPNPAGSFASFQAQYGTNLADYLSAWGVDTTDHVTWTVLDHNSEFAVQPEPATLALLALGGLGLAAGRFIRRRRRVA